MGLFDKSGKEGGKKAPQEAGQQPKFTRKDRDGDATYEIWNGTDAESARAFLLTKRVDKELYYIVVETPEGNWGMDVKGLYLERLLPWQTNASSTAVCEGHIIPGSWTDFGLAAAAKRANDNFIAKVECGKCEHQWPDGLRYRNVTAVRCPKCKAVNKVNSDNVEVWFV